VKLFFGAQAHYETRHGVWFEKTSSSYRLDVHCFSKLLILKSVGKLNSFLQAF
jgi:hypothetical protein